MIENCKKCKSEWFARTKTNDRVVGSRDGCHNCHNNKHCATPLTSIYCPSIVQHPLTTQIFSPDNWYARFVKCCSAAIWAKAHTCKYEATTLSHRCALLIINMCQHICKYEASILWHRCALLITEMCGRHRAHITQKQSHKPHSQSLLTYMADLLNWSTRV